MGFQVEGEGSGGRCVVQSAGFSSGGGKEWWEVCSAECWRSAVGRG